jgi:hypothetical protein
MAYLINLPDFPPLEKLLSDNGYHITCDLSNELLIFRNNDINENEENFVEDFTEELSQELQDAINKFAEDNDLY